MQTWLSKNWWVLSINGLIAILFGYVALMIPIDTIMSYVDIFGYIILASGVILIVVAFNNMKKKGSMVLWLFEGIFNLAVGIVIVFNSSGSIELFLVFFGIWSLLLGLVQAVMGFSLEKHKSAKNILIINALLCIALGIILFYNPLADDSIFKTITGIIALLAGLLLIYISFALKGTAKKQIPQEIDQQQLEESSKH